MEWPKSAWLRALFCFLLGCSWFFHYGAMGCLDEERNALLEIKSSINYPFGDIATALRSWKDGTDCCSWKRVKCDSATARVTEISLGSVRESRSNWDFNATLFLPFQQLQSLDLSGNSIYGWTDDKDYQRLSRLTKLEKLDLSSNLFNQTFLHYLAALKSLKHLRISNNQFDGPVPIKELSTFSKLEILDLSYRNFGRLGHLLPAQARVTGPIPPAVESLGSLRVINLSANGINVSQSIQGLCKLKNLQELRLSENEFDGTVPLCLGDLRNLQVLDLSGNRFSGKIPASLISNLTSLVYFSLANNRFSGSFKLGSLAHHSKLKGVELKNNDGLKVETEYPPWVPTFQLEVLSLSNCEINGPAGVIPSFLYSQYNLTHVDLSHNKLQGNFPTWLLENNTRFQLMNLRNNSLTGDIHLLRHVSLEDLILLDISINHINGQLPIKTGVLMPNLEILNMSYNAFQGSIPPSLGNMRRLEHVDLSHNNLSGELPERLFANCLSLSVLKLSNNRLSGEIHATYSNLTSLNYLYLDNNLFTGSISPTLFDNFLTALNVEGNHLSGRLPSQIGNVSSLSLLILRGNYFEGTIPFEIGKLQSLQYLDLSKNNLHGSIPYPFNLSFLRHMYLENNAFSGFAATAPLENSHLVTLDIRYNEIGFLPSWIDGLSYLKALLLKGNYLHGPFPIELCQLKNLNMLDLSYNNLSGSVPSCIKSLAFGRATDTYVTFDVDNIIFSNYSGDSSLIPYLSRRINTGPMIVGTDAKVEFITKSRSDFYKGGILQYMSGLDLSCNRLTGEIPLEIGQLTNLRALNLSNNQLGGQIPRSFSNLSVIESLDLSHNRLTGGIPSDLIELNFLAIFKVGYNDLSGPIPESGQFNTFEADSYEGNPLLCGKPVNKSCFSTPPPIPPLPEAEDNDWDLSSFYAAILGSYFVSFIGTVVVFYYSKRCAIPCID